MPVAVTPITPHFGAEISGVDLTRPLDEATRRDLIDAQNQWGVTIHRNTGLDDDSHVAFSRIFGHLEVAPHKGRKVRYRREELFDAGNLDGDGEIIQDELIRLHKKGDRLWHTDSSFMPMRSAYSLLLAHEVPPVGGETWFADTRGAYDDLPQAMKDRIEGLEAVHSIWWSRKVAGYPFTEEDIDSRPSARHPLVHVHQGSGRKALYIAAHARDIVGLPRDEGRALLAELAAFATQPKYVFKVKYAVGDMVIWDNRGVLHRACRYDEDSPRDMHRTTLTGDEPVR